MPLNDKEEQPIRVIFARRAQLHQMEHVRGEDEIIVEEMEPILADGEHWVGAKQTERGEHADERGEHVDSSQTHQANLHLVVAEDQMRGDLARGHCCFVDQIDAHYCTLMSPDGTRRLMEI